MIFLFMILSNGGSEKHPKFVYCIQIQSTIAWTDFRMPIFYYILSYSYPQNLNEWANAEENSIGQLAKKVVVEK
jgi:hypothetical protein